MKNVSPARALSLANPGEPVTSGAPAAGAISSPVLCRVCRSSKRHLVDAAIAHGVSVRAVGEAQGFSKSAVARHGATCLPAKIARANVDRVDRLNTSGLLEAMVRLQRTTQDQLDAAIFAKDKPVNVAKLIREVRENVQVMGRFLGAFAGEGAKTVDNRVQIVALQNMTVEDLRALTTTLRSKVAS